MKRLSSIIGSFPMPQYVYQLAYALEFSHYFSPLFPVRADDSVLLKLAIKLFSEHFGLLHFSSSSDNNQNWLKSNQCQNKDVK